MKWRVLNCTCAGELNRVFPNLKFRSDLSSLGYCKALNELHLPASELHKIPAELTKITKLRLTNLKAEHMPAFYRLTHLEELRLDTRIHKDEAELLRSSTLTKLDLNKAVYASLDFIHRFPNLKYLNIQTLRSKDLLEINKSRSLRSVGLKERPTEELRRLCKFPIELF